MNKVNEEMKKQERVEALEKNISRLEPLLKQDK